MSDIAFGIEVAVVGFLVVVFTLIILAFVLTGFNKVIAPRKKKIDNPSLPAREATSVQDKTVEETASKPSAVEGDKGTEKLEVAAALGALMYVLETGSASGFRIKQVRPLQQANNFWSQSGRTRSVQTRQDFMLFRKGKFR